MGDRRRPGLELPRRPLGATPLPRHGRSLAPATSRPPTSPDDNVSGWVSHPRMACKPSGGVKHIPSLQRRRPAIARASISAQQRLGMGFTPADGLQTIGRRQTHPESAAATTGDRARDAIAAGRKRSGDIAPRSRPVERRKAKRDGTLLSRTWNRSSSKAPPVPSPHAKLSSRASVLANCTAAIMAGHTEACSRRIRSKPQSTTLVPSRRGCATGTPWETSPRPASGAFRFPGDSIPRRPCTSSSRLAETSHGDRVSGRGASSRRTGRERWSSASPSRHPPSPGHSPHAS